MRIRKLRGGLLRFAAHLQQGAQIVMRFKVAGIIFDVVARQRLFQFHARVVARHAGTFAVCANRQHLQPEMGHFITGAIAGDHALRWIIRVREIIARIVVHIAHHNGGAVRQLDRLRITVDRLPV